MARIAPFRALRPAPAVAPQVSSVPYDVVSADEARALAEGNLLSFLRVTRSELELPPGSNPYADEVYARARANLDRLKRAAPLELDSEPSLYLYRLRMGEHEQIGVAGGFSVDEYESGGIKRHEKTRRDKEDDRTRHIVTLRAQTGVVFLTFRRSAEIAGVIARARRAQPLFDFVAADGVAHTVWRVASVDRDALVAAFAALPVLYIADGHHRAASAARARQEIRGGAIASPAAPGAGSCDDFLAVAFADDQVRILPYHRVVHDLGGRDAGRFLAELAARLERVADAPQPSLAGRFSCYLDGRWSTFVLPPSPPDGAPIERLDCERLQRIVLTPLLGIEDLRTDKRIDFVGGIRGTAELERLVDSGLAKAAFAMFPVTMADLFAISDAGEIMPPKSTWFEPKLRDGLLIREI